MRSRRHVGLSWLLIGALIGGMAIPNPALAQNPGAGTLALDTFGGILGRNIYSSNRTEPAPDSRIGWEAGTTFRFHRWLGVTGALGSLPVEDTQTSHFLVGAHVTTPYAFGNNLGTRVFAHALAGVVSADLASTPAARGSEFVIGGGFDLLVFGRMQFDYVRLNLNGLPAHNSRVFFGAVVPLCFRGCGTDDGVGIRVGSAK